MEFLKHLFSSGDYMPHGYCYLWNPGLVWLHVISDLLIAIAYAAIPVTLLYFIKKRRDVPFNWMFVCFGVFIVACGATHAMEVWNLWHAAYWLAGIVKVITAAASVPTAILLVQLVPKALALPSLEVILRANATLEKEVRERRDTELRFRRLVEGVQDYAIFLLDPGGRVKTWDSGAERIKGYQAEEIIGQHFSRFYPREEIERGKPERELRVAAAEGRCEDEGWHLRKDGSRFWANAVITPVWSPQGDLLGFSRVIRDLTARKLSEAKFRDLLNSAPDAMVIVDQQGRIQLVNVQTEKAFGYTRGELQGQPVEILLPEQLQDRHIGHRSQYFADPRSRPMGTGLELFGRRKDGSEFPVEISLSPVKTEEGLLVSAAIRDITKRKLAEQTLARQTAELAGANSQLTAANKELEAFSYSVAHDLRAPLRHIDGFSRILLEEHGPDLKPNAQHCLQRIQQGVRQMGRLVDDLLNLGRVGRQALHRRPTSLKSLVLNVLSDLKPGTQGRSLEWHIDDLPVVECDPALMKLVFVNLLSNAIKFTGPQKVAEIHVGQMIQNGELVIFVRDNGIGFNMRYVHKLFGIFQRLHRQEDFEGTGVGLASVQRIVHKHGGRVWAEAEPCKGATFYFTIGAPKESESGAESDVTLRGGACQRAEQTSS